MFRLRFDRWSVFCLILATACLAAVPAAAKQWSADAVGLHAADPTSICLAYRLNHRIRALCGNNTRTIIRMRALADFAIREYSSPASPRLPGW